jgi:hypothetical protein
MDFVLHWGCRDRPGHALTYPHGGFVRDFECEGLMVPRPHHLDGTILFLPQPEEPGHGALTYLPAPDRTILAWWDRTFDKRGRCNMAIIASGKRSADECWQLFTESFHDLAAQLQKPSIKRQ